VVRVMVGTLGLTPGDGCMVFHRWLNNACRTFYLQRLQEHNWTRGDYSDVLVQLSRIYSHIRGDVVPEAVLTEKQVRR
jgi:hypothetical protein